MNKKYVLVESKHGGNEALKLTEPPYDGIIVSYGKVSFNEVDDHLKLAFEYEIHDFASKGFDAELFEQYLGLLLEELIYEGVQKNSLTYTGGIDENRADDSGESGLQ
tara:strand:+ start:3986 stop:4306 length:321 start_codon:yes stop_codon:yes gene_type:complete